MICDSSAWLNSSATETTIRIPVALNTFIEFGSIALKIRDGISATSARKIAPNKTMRLETRFR